MLLEDGRIGRSSGECQFSPNYAGLWGKIDPTLRHLFRPKAWYPMITAAGSQFVR